MLNNSGVNRFLDILHNVLKLLVINKLLSISLVEEYWAGYA
jgi:hypothetical protein